MGPDSADSNDVQLYREYHSATFDRLHSTLIKRRMIRKDVPRARRSFWSQIRSGIFERDEALGLLDRYFEFVDTHLKHAIQNHSIAYWMHAYRRLGHGSCTLDSRPETIQLVRSTLDAAIQKHGQRTLCAGLQPIRDVPRSHVLDGSLATSSQGALYQQLCERNSMVLCSFGATSLLELYGIEQLASEICALMQVRRGVGKGAALMVNHRDPSLFHTHCNDDLFHTFEVVDLRSQHYISSATATVFEQEAEQDDLVLLARGLSQTDNYDAEYFQKVCFHFADTKITNSFRPNFVWSPFQLRQFRTAHLPWSIPFEKKHGVSLDSVLIVLAALSWAATLDWKGCFERLAWHWCRGYDGMFSITSLRERIAQTESLAKGVLGIAKDSSCDTEAAISFLSLSTDAAHRISLQTRGPHAQLLPVTSTHWLVDYAHFAERMYYLFYDLSIDDQNFKGDLLEALMQDAHPPLPSTPLRHAGESRQVDATFECEDLLVIVECRAKAMSLAFDRGDARAISYRLNRVVRPALADADEKARWLSRNPKGDNFDIHRFRQILPIAVTPFAEWCPPDPSLWLTDVVPRILTPRELKDLLASGDLADIAQGCQSTINLSM